MTIDELQYGHKRQHLEDMEKEIYLDRLTLTYSGYLNYKEFMDMVKRWCAERGYYSDVQSTKEKVAEKGFTKKVALQLQKKISHMHLSVLNIDISFSDMTEESKEVDGRMMKVEKGDVEVIFHGYLMTSVKASWETKAYMGFLRTVIDKFIYKLDRPKYRGAVVNDGKDLAKEMMGFLNSYKGRVKG